MKEYRQNKKNNFIAGWYIKKKICDDLIKYYEKSKDKRDGSCHYQGITGVYKAIKDSSDLALSPALNDTIPVNYLNAVSKVVDEYKSKYCYSDYMQSNWKIVENYNVQKYEPKGGFKRYHFERSGTTDKAAFRHLVFMTYLNDVKDKGETEFFYQKFKVKPEKGLTLIWPADWTFTHRGIPSSTEVKYIATGWYSYV